MAAFYPTGVFQGVEICLTDSQYALILKKIQVNLCKNCINGNVEIKGIPIFFYKQFPKNISKNHNLFKKN